MDLFTITDFLFSRLMAAAPACVASIGPSSPVATNLLKGSYATPRGGVNRGYHFFSNLGLTQKVNFLDMQLSEFT
jgi:hypothetical protein